MSKLYNKDHVVYCDVKKKITITVEQKNPSNEQIERSLDISLTDENDLYFLFTAKIFASDYQRLKDQQGLLVEYNAFGQMLTDLLAKCLAEESSNSPRYLLQFSESSEPNILQIVETTDFRRLTHLAIQFTAASDETLKAYLVSYIKRFKDKYFAEQEVWRSTESNLSRQLASSSQISIELKNNLQDLKENKQSEISELRRRFEAQIEELISSNKKTIEMLKLKHSSEVKTLQDDHEAEIAGLRLKVASQASVLSNHNSIEEDLRNQIDSLSKELKASEAALSNSQKDNDAKNSEILSLRVQCEQLQSTITQLASKHDNIESMFSVEQRRASSLEADLTAQREQIRDLQEEVQKKTRQVEKLEKQVRQQTGEVNKANSIIKQLQKDLKNSQNKARLRGQVAAEQERVLGERAAEAEEAAAALRDAREQLRSASERASAAEAQVASLNAALADARATIDNNENIISWLNRQVSESYTQSVQQRLQSSGIPIVPSYMAEKQPPPLLPKDLNTAAAAAVVSSTFRPEGLSSSRTPTTVVKPSVVSTVAKPLGSGLGSKKTFKTTVLDGVVGGMAGLSVRPPTTTTMKTTTTTALAPLFSLPRQMPELAAGKGLTSGAPVGASDCESSLSRPTTAQGGIDAHSRPQQSSLVSAYFPPQKAGGLN